MNIQMINTKVMDRIKYAQQKNIVCTLEEAPMYRISSIITLWRHFPFGKNTSNYL